jgi:hypothetical protein
MLNTKPHTVTHGVDGDAMTLVLTEGLNALLHEFRAKRPRCLSAHAPAHSTVV